MSLAGRILLIGGLEGITYFSFSQIPDLPYLFIYGVALRSFQSLLLLPSIHSALRDRQTDAVITHTHTHTHRSVRASHLHTPKCKLLFGRHCRRWSNIDTQTERQTDRQTSMQYGVLQHPRKLLPLLWREMCKEERDYTELWKIHESGFLNNTMISFVLQLAR